MQLKIAGRIEPVQWTPVFETAVQKNSYLHDASQEATKSISFTTVDNSEKKSLAEPASSLNRTGVIPPPSETAADLLPKKKVIPAR